MRVVHEWNHEKATIRVEGLTTSTRVLHISDAHMGLIDDRDPEELEACQGRGDRFHDRHENRDDRGAVIPQETAFRHLLQQAAEENVDLVALTGDIIDFPSQANIEYARQQIDDSGVPALYTAGNHDWHLPGRESGAATRSAYWPALEPLHHDEPAFARRQVGDLLFLAIDNSTHQIDQDQLEATRAALAEGLPTVALIHIPLSLPTLRGPVIEKWGHSILMADPDRPGASEEDTASTLEFPKLLGRAENLVAILCGHIHQGHVDTLSPWAAQYLAPPAFAGECRLFEWTSL